MNNARGFTLVEIIVAMGVSLVLLGSIYLAIQSAQRSSAGIERKVTAQQDARGALEIMAMEIRMASFNPNYVTGIWVGNAQYKGIQTATANTIRIQMDINENSAIGDPNEDITYNYDTANQRITRDTGGGAQAFLGDTAASGRPRTVHVINNDPNVNVPVFRYYDGTGAEIDAASLPASIPNIRMIAITLAVETNDIDPSTGQRRRMVYSTRVIPRNFVIGV